MLGIGNAIVDVLARADDAFLAKHGMPKGAMALIDGKRAEAIYDAMGPAVEVSGGSAANTIVGVASLGGRAAFVGKVKDDELGRDLRARHPRRRRRLRHAAGLGRPSTARCYILVTPDGERTMNTYLGAAQDLHPNDIDADAVAAARSPISRAICGIRRTPRRPSSRRRRSPMAPSATLRSRCRMRSASTAIGRSSSI